MKRLKELLIPVAVLLLLLVPAIGAEQRTGGRSATDVGAAVVDGNTALAVTTGPLRVVSHNICGGASCGVRGATGPLSSVEGLIDQYDPHIVLLQEVCWSQYQSLAAHTFSSGTYQMGYTVMIDNYTGCGVSDCSVNDDADPANDNKQCWIGQLVAAQGTLSNRDEIPLGGERYQLNSSGAPVYPPRTFNALCYDATLTGFGTRIVKACSVHLRAFYVSGNAVNTRARTAQAARLASDLDGDIAAGKIVVVGGDFNSTPASVTMNAFYRLDTNAERHWGLFYEADQDDSRYYDPAYCSSSQSSCRSGETTIGSSKYDYIFYSETADSASLSGLPIDEPVSDHDFYRGLATVRTS